jgi:hypothetical protein
MPNPSHSHPIVWIVEDHDILRKNLQRLCAPARVRLTEKQLELDFIERIVARLRQSSSSEGTISGRNRRTE